MWKITVKTFLILLNIFICSGIENRRKCFQDLNEVKKAVDNRDIWGLKMLDSSAKVPDGILNGNIINYGSFDECLSISNKEKGINGKYCQIKIFLSRHKLLDIIKDDDKNIRGGFIKLMQVNSYYQDGQLGLVLGVCTPESCRASDLTKYYKEMTFKNELINENHLPFSKETLQYNLERNRTNLDFMINDESCKTKEVYRLQTEIEKGDWVMIILLCIFPVFVIAGTFYEHSAHYFKVPGTGFFGRFSLIKNSKILFRKNINSDYIGCIDGIRVISMFWIIVTYRIFYSITFPIQNIKDFDTFINNPLSMLIINGNLGIDTFFVVSGILISYKLFKYNGRNFNLLYIGAYRYIRLTILFALIILFYTTLLDNFSYGPNSLLIEASKEACLRNWWQNLLYIQNFASFENICVQQSWYLAVDTQVFILSLLLLLLFKKWPKYTMYICWLLIVCSILTSFGVTYSYELPGIINFGNYLNYYYKQTHVRYGPYLMGLLLGYHLQSLNDNKIRFHMHKFIVYLCWVISIMILLCVIFAPYNIIDKTYNKLEHSIYNGLHRHAWSLAICWIIFACRTGYGGPANKFLSMYIFRVLSRLTYSIFLIYAAFQMILLTNMRTSQYFDAWNLLLNLYSLWKLDFWSEKIGKGVKTIGKCLFWLHKKHISMFPTIIGESVSIVIISMIITLSIEIPLKIDSKSFIKYVDGNNKINKNLPSMNDRKCNINSLDIIDSISVVSIN